MNLQYVFVFVYLVLLITLFSLWLTNNPHLPLTLQQNTFTVAKTQQLLCECSVYGKYWEDTVRCSINTASVCFARIGLLRDVRMYVTKILWNEWSDVVWKSAVETKKIYNLWEAIGDCVGSR